MKNKKIKVIHISSASSSFSVPDYEEDIYRAWFAQVCYQIKKFYPKIEVEGWTIERKYKKEETKIHNNLKFRIFPTEVAFRHGMEISLSLIKALLDEQEKAIKEGKKLIIHLHEHHTLQSYLILLSLDKKKVKIVSQHHGGRSPFQNLIEHKKFFLFLPIFILWQIIEKIILKKINVVYGSTELEMTYLKNTLKGSVVKFQTMGIGEEYFKEIVSKKIARKKLSLDMDKKYIIFIGRVRKVKGISELLEAMEKLKKENIELIIIGKGPHYEYYKDYVEKNKFENAKLLGAVYGDKKMLYLAACDYLILPSRGSEGSPIVIMEAMAMNLPFITTKVGGIPLMFENKREGILVEPKSTEEIVKAIKEILKWKKKDIRKYAENYKWGKIIKQTIEDYEKA